MEFLANLKLEVEIFVTKIADLFGVRVISSDQKESIIKYYKAKYGMANFVETGTYIGDMLWALKDDFESLVSIELSEVLYKRAKRRFSGVDNVKLIKGDSGSVIPKLLKGARVPTLFWLDAHWSGGSTAKADTRTPIQKELRAILKHKIKNHAILIDDADMFNGTYGYPSMSEVKKMVKELTPWYSVFIKDGIIRIVPIRKK